MEKKHQLRFKNTILAAVGGLVLSLLFWIAAHTSSSVLHTQFIVVVLSFFWLINFGFIYFVASGRSEIFSDPSLTLPQMYWAASSCFFCFAVTRGFEVPCYFLIFLILAFGIFRLKPKQFYGFCFFIVVSLAFLTHWGYLLNDSAAPDLKKYLEWGVFSFCVMSLGYLCQSISAIRWRLHIKNAQLQDALASKNLFLANMSHEIRTPINGVMGMLQLLQRAHLDAQQARYVSIAYTSAQALLAVVNDILDFSKIEAGKLELNFEEFNLSKLVGDLATVTAHLAYRKNLAFVLDMVGIPKDMYVGDCTRLNQVLNNILNNAVKFTSEGKIVLHACIQQRESGDVFFVCSVKDSGIGIAPEKHAAIFESFSQEDASTTRQFGGTGLGLAIVKRLIEAMNGEITLESQKGKGSEFIFSVPLVESPIAKLQTPSNLSPDLRLLLIDSDTENAQIVARQVQEWGLKVDVFDSLMVALSAIEVTMKNYFLPHKLLILNNITENDLDDLHKLKSIHGYEKITTVFGLKNSLDASVNKHYANGCDQIVSLPLTKEILISIFSLLSITNQANAEAVPSMSLLSDLDSIQNAACILVVEDNPINQEVASFMLEDLGYRSQGASNGKEALDILKQSELTFPLILMDCQMPVLDGYQVTEMIRRGEAGERYRLVPIVAMTANAMRGDREKCIDAGMDDYLSKPIDEDDLKQKLEKWLV